ncbi:MAG: glycosyltransferase family protein [Phycisphaerales bacterium]
MARAQLVNLGRAGDPWLFIPRALTHLTPSPADGEVRFLLASAFGQLGLPTLASEQLAALAPAAARHPAVTQLTTRLATLRDDRVPAETRIAACLANLEALAAHRTHPLDLQSHVEAWANRARETEVFRATCGNALTRRDGTIIRCAPDIQDATDTVARLLKDGAETAPLPLYLEGAHPPCWLMELAARTSIRPDGSQTPIHWVCADINEFLDGLALADLRPMLSQSRVRVFVGPDAGDRLAAHLAARLDLHISGPVMATPTITTPIRDRDGRDVLAIIDHAEQQQSTEVERLKQQIATAYAQRTRAWYHARFAGAAPAAPLRILLPTTCYSTFIQHATRDFAAALTAAGHDARLLIEPDDTAQLSQLAAARAIAEQQPDLIILINYTRATLGDSIPANLPVVTWVQDAMPHLFARELGESLTHWDWIVGHLHPEFFRDCAYPQQRTLATPLLVSARKFHGAPISQTTSARFACELAHVGNQSDTAESLRDALIAQASDHPRGPQPLCDVIAAAYRRVAAIAAEDRWTLDAMDRCATDAFRDATSRVPDPGTRMFVANTICRPIADRLIRHQTLQWAAYLCHRHGWRFHLYGRGWDNHPTLAAHARGVLAHGDDLRAAYQAARVNLHASSSWMLHQRTMECALSGGLILVRRKHDDLELQRNHALDRLAAGDPEPLTVWTHQCHALGVEPQIPATRPPTTTVECWGPGGLPDQTIGLMGDLAQTTFATPEQLEMLVARAVTDDAWRSEQISGLQQRTRAQLTYDAFVPRLLERITADLA